jgi:hypothetical protein
MTNLFIQEDDEIKIDFAVAVTDKGKIYSSASMAELKDMLKDIKCEFKEYEAVFKRPSFKDVVELNKSSISANAGGLSFNPSAERYQKMVKLIKSWTLTDASGVITEPTEISIGQLNPGIADIISSLLELEIGSSY